MSFHTELMHPTTGWPADLVSAGIATSAAQVYDGRRPQRVARTDREVWIEALPPEQIGNGLHRLELRPYLVHIYETEGPDGDLTGRSQLRLVEALLETAARRYTGAHVFGFTGALANIVATRAQVLDLDEEPDSVRDVSAALRVEFLVKG